MRKVKYKIKLMPFLFACIGMLFAISIIASLFVISNITHRAAEDSIKTSISKEARRAVRVMETNPDATEEELDSGSEFDDCYVVVLDQDSNVLLGSFPEEYSEAAEVKLERSREVRSIEADGVEYYIYDIGVGDRKSSHDMYIRALADPEKIMTFYNDMYNSYILIVICLSLLMVAVAGLVYRSIAKPINEMVARAGHISESGAYTERMNGEGFLYETEVLVNAYNSLLDRTEDLVQQHEKFNTDVSHELRTPVAVIHSECELVETLHAEELPPDVLESVGVIKGQSEKMKEMINELLYLSRVGRDDALRNTERMDIVDILESVSEDAVSLLSDGKKLECDYRSAYAEVDLTLIMIAIKNLITNAIRYSSEGSAIYVSNTYDDDFIYISVRDEGKGITPQDQEKIFDLYYQVSGERNSEGFGLGLPLALGIARRHGGDIKVESEKDKGSTFTLIIPVSKEEG